MERPESIARAGPASCTLDMLVVCRFINSFVHSANMFQAPPVCQVLSN